VSSPFYLFSRGGSHISCTLHDDLLNQLQDSLCLIRCRTSAVCVAKFLVLTAERTLLTANFRRGVKNTTKFPLLFKRITARNTSIFPLKFCAIFRWKFAKTKNEIRTFHLHYFCIVLYMGTDKMVPREIARPGSISWGCDPTILKSGPSWCCRLRHEWEVSHQM